MPSRSIIRTGVGPHREPGNRFPAMAAINLLAARAARVQSRRNLSRSLSPKLDHSHSITRFDRSRTGPKFLGGHEMRTDTKLYTAASLSALWDGGPIRRLRAGDGACLLYGRRLSLHLMLQPGIAGPLLSDPVLVNQGLTSRLLIAMPDTMAGTRFWADPTEASGAAIRRYY